MKGVNVEIMGQNLTVTSDEGDQWVKAVATTVDEKIRDIRAGTQAVSSIHLAIMAALNFAEDLERLRREQEQLIERIEAMSRRLSEAIDGKSA
ncbi:MAG TPA: cell division protein ZapA [Candidatus Binataceae bacterium]|nr:cell division protein ZapA [Candidatus Binataceae bacterium]